MSYVGLGDGLWSFIPNDDFSFRFFVRVDRVLRRSLGVSETAKADSTVKPAPPIDPNPLDEKELEAELRKPNFEIPDEFKDSVRLEYDEVPGSKASHDEL